MGKQIRRGTRQHIVEAIADLDHRISHALGESTGYDVLHDGRRCSLKAVVGLAAGKVLGAALGPYDFKGDLESSCFRVLRTNGAAMSQLFEYRYFDGEDAESPLPRRERADQRDATLVA